VSSVLLKGFFRFFFLGLASLFFARPCHVVVGGARCVSISFFILRK